MRDAPEPEDPFVEVEKLLGAARDDAARQVQAWQKAHQVTDWGYQLVRSFNEERRKIEPTDAITNNYAMLANVSGVSFMNLAADIQKPIDATVTVGTSRVLLSGLQSNVASYISAPVDFGIENPFPETLRILEAQHVPLESRLPALNRRIGALSRHFSDVIAGVEQDLLNQTNPLAISNAAKNLRELLTAFIHHVAPDGAIKNWQDLEVDAEKKRPTRRSRLAFHAYLGIPKKPWPQSWVEQTEKRVRSVLESFDQLNKFTHINEGTAPELQTARVALDTFVNELLLYLETAEEAKGVLHDFLQQRVENELQQLAEGELHSWLEEGVSHALTDMAYCDELRIDGTSPELVAFSGLCRVTCTFQRGSNGDVRRGEGAEWKGSKSFRFRGTAKASDLEEIAITDFVFLED